jgi:hypothetical protein
MYSYLQYCRIVPFFGEYYGMYFTFLAVLLFLTTNSSNLQEIHSLVVFTAPLDNDTTVNVLYAEAIAILSNKTIKWTPKSHETIPLETILIEYDQSILLLSLLFYKSFDKSRMKISSMLALGILGNTVEFLLIHDLCYCVQNNGNFNRRSNSCHHSLLCSRSWTWTWGGSWTIGRT